MRAVLLAVLLASVASAATLQECRKAYGSVVAAGSKDTRCKALVALGLCINENLASMTQTERLNAQGFFDAARLTSSCAGVDVPKVNVALLAAAELSNTNEAASALRERRATDSVSIWDINDRYNDLQDSIVGKAAMQELQDTVNALQAGDSESMNRVRDNIMAIVDDRLDSLTKQITSAVDAAVVTLNSVSSTLNTITLSRIAKLEGDVITTTNSIGADLIKQVNVDTEATKATVATIAATQVTIDRRVTALENVTDSIITTNIGDVSTGINRLLGAFNKTHFFDSSLPIFRYNTWHTYSQYHSWYCDNLGTFFGGVAPSTWTDNNGIASQMSADKNVLRTLFNKKMTPGWTANVNAHEWYYPSSTDGEVTGALFRIRNTGAAAISWSPSFYYSSYGSWAEQASIALNGNNMWTTSNNCGAQCTITVALSIPANRISTVIIIVPSGIASTTRPNLLVFINDCLKLPAGLQYVDDLDTATGGWEA